ncbi:uncharacterized protein isoform X1 [Takifugu rubripes]|uniref:uncharacterized protein isoform X1 n=1 Tax=Takifugu rubripes TaxID=31033 RepID=UPI0011453212|nr:uncharacterized protein LOC101078610 isoform X1 [Takifugu rubripes]XP_029698659.1 uncharacterized protein LOC101078610 isoform X1 [Takifugu rubripes]
MEMCSLQTVALIAAVAAASFAPVCPQFCPSVDQNCHGTTSDYVRSRSETSVSPLIQDLDQFQVSSKKLMEAFPIDPVDGNFVRTVKNCIFSRSLPTPLKGPLRLAAVSTDVIGGILNLDVAAARSEEFLRYASGGALMVGSEPLAHRYGGHQFGYWAGQLGDGRAHTLGQFTNRNGEVWELQLKGSGKTPYSRSGDGRAVVRSSVREFLCSEAMHFLGVPTSRAASLIVSDEPVLRDQFYDGNVKAERGAVVLRVARSWFRIGSLEILSESGEFGLLRELMDFVIDEHFPSISSDDPDKYLVFYSTVVNETAHLIARWTSVGFAHGVCNTDNFSLLSVTIDYGPFGFVESYDPSFVPNVSDDEGRYSIGAQAGVGHFNLGKLLAALRPVLTGEQQKEAQSVLNGYADVYQRRILQLFRAKLGLLGEEEDDGFLIALLLKVRPASRPPLVRSDRCWCLQLMEDTRSDFTLTFRQLSEASAEQLHGQNFTQMWALEGLSSHQLFPDWLGLYLPRLRRQQRDDDSGRQNRMKRVNPRYVLRNWMAESAVRKAERNDFSEVALLHRTLSSPFVTQEAAEEAGYAAKPPAWARGLKVSCSS